MVTAQFGIKSRKDIKLRLWHIIYIWYITDPLNWTQMPQNNSGKPTMCLLSYVNHGNYSSLPYTEMCATLYCEGTFTLISKVHVELGPSFLPPLITLSEDDPEWQLQRSERPIPWPCGAAFRPPGRGSVSVRAQSSTDLHGMTKQPPFWVCNWNGQL